MKKNLLHSFLFLFTTPIFAFSEDNLASHPDEIYILENVHDEKEPTIHISSATFSKEGDEDLTVSDFEKISHKFTEGAYTNFFSLLHDKYKEASLGNEEYPSKEVFIHSLISSGVYKKYETVGKEIEKLLEERNLALARLSEKDNHHRLSKALQEFSYQSSALGDINWEELWMTLAQLLWQFFLKDLLVPTAALSTSLTSTAHEYRVAFFLEKENLLLKHFYSKKDLLYGVDTPSDRALLLQESSLAPSDPYEQELKTILDHHKKSVHEKLNSFVEALAQ